MAKCNEKTEVYSRVTGYFRPVTNWNKGKQQEFKDRRIPKGSKCRMIRDDFMPGLVYFEHLRCPSAPTVTAQKNCPKNPVIHNNKPAMALA